MSTRVLVIGGGGREHALAWGLARSPHVDEVVCAPGNPGMATIGECMPVVPTDPAAVADLAAKLDADLVVVGPEDPLVAGVVDAVQAAGIHAFGPNAAAARLEGSKAWMKDVLVAAGVPTARYATFTAGDETDAVAFLETLPGLYVVKTDGLAAGKGVVVTESIAEARDAVRAYLSGAAFGDAGRTCVIEEGLTGPEVSLFALCDGKRAAGDRRRAGPQARVRRRPRPEHGRDGRVLAGAVRRNRRGRRDDGTGGAPDLGRARAARRTVPRRALLRAHAHARPARRCSSTTCASATPSPRCWSRGSRATSSCTSPSRRPATLRTPIALTDASCVGVVLASEGYPPAPDRKGDVIDGLDRAAAHEGVVVFHSGTARDDDGRGRDQRRPGADRHRGRRRRRAGARPRVRGRGRDFVARRPLPSRHRRPGPPVIPRYSLPEISALFTDEARFGAWLEVEVLAVEAWARLGVVPEADARAVRERARLRRRRDPRAREGHRPRRRRVRRRRAGDRSDRRRARGCTTGSRRATSSTPRSRCR